jgi:hypothetical protein
MNPSAAPPTSNYAWDIVPLPPPQPVKQHSTAMRNIEYRIPPTSLRIIYRRRSVRLRLSPLACWLAVEYNVE